LAQVHGPMRSGFLCLVALLAGVTVAVAQTPNHAAPPDASCPGDKVVWVNTRSGIYHFRGERYFGSTKQGKFICEREADGEGDRPTHNGQ
jgi:hypothetical protein